MAINFVFASLAACIACDVVQRFQLSGQLWCSRQRPLWCIVQQLEASHWGVHIVITTAIMAGETSGPNTALWLPCLLLAHAIAIFWILRTQLLARRQEKTRAAAAAEDAKHRETPPTGTCPHQPDCPAPTATAEPHSSCWPHSGTLNSHTHTHTTVLLQTWSPGMLARCQTQMGTTSAPRLTRCKRST